MPEQLKQVVYYPIVSSTIAAVAYDPDGSILLVRFRDRQGQPVQGQHYEFEAVPEWIYQELIDPVASKSRGEFFDRIVKRGGFIYHKVEEEQK